VGILLALYAVRMNECEVYFKSVLEVQHSMKRCCVHNALDDAALDQPIYCYQHFANHAQCRVCAELHHTMLLPAFAPFVQHACVQLGSNTIDIQSIIAADTTSIKLNENLLNNRLMARWLQNKSSVTPYEIASASL
jgi:hypothetical protein